MPMADETLSAICERSGRGVDLALVDIVADAVAPCMIQSDEDRGKINVHNFLHRRTIMHGQSRSGPSRIRIREFGVLHTQFAAHSSLFES